MTESCNINQCLNSQRISHSFCNQQAKWCLVWGFHDKLQWYNGTALYFAANVFQIGFSFIQSTIISFVIINYFPFHKTITTRSIAVQINTVLITYSTTASLMIDHELTNFTTHLALASRNSIFGKMAAWHGEPLCLSRLAVNTGRREINVHGCWSLVKTTFAPICACNIIQRIWCHNASTIRSRDVTHELWWRHNTISAKTNLSENGEISYRQLVFSTILCSGHRIGCQLTLVSHWTGSTFRNSYSGETLHRL